MLNEKKIEERFLEKAMESAKRWDLTEKELPEIRKELLRGGPSLADTPSRVAAFEKREIKRILLDKPDRAEGFAKARIDDFQERMMGSTLDWSKFPPDEISAKAGRAVCRIVNMPETDEPANAYGFGTGFLVSPNLLMTNHHVLADRSETEGVGANFEHDYLPAGGSKLGHLFELDPDTFFEANKELDFALVAVRSQNTSNRSTSSYGHLTLIPAIGKILVGQPVNIIQHPEGGPKVYATQKNELVKIFDPGIYLQYKTDTLRGSSGSPAFNVSWEIVGLHHSSVPLIHNGKILDIHNNEWKRGMDVESIRWIANEAIRVSSVVKFLKELYEKMEDKGSGKSRLLQELLALAVDPLGDKEGQPATSLGTSRSPAVVKSSDINDQIAIRRMDNITINISGNANTSVNSTSREADSGANGNLAKKDEATDPQRALSVGQLEAGSIRFDPDESYRNRKGYDPKFFKGFTIDTPRVAEHRMDEILKLSSTGRPTVLKYHHFSLVMNRSRRMLMWAAANADYSESRRDERSRTAFGRDKWIRDERIPAEFQIEHFNFYGPAAFADRGHIVRREDSAWGDSAEEIEYSNSDTFHYPNATPQHMQFNQSKYDGLW